MMYYYSPRLPALSSSFVCGKLRLAGRRRKRIHNCQPASVRIVRGRPISKNNHHLPTKTISPEDVSMKDAEKKFSTTVVGRNTKVIMVKALTAAASRRLLSAISAVCRASWAAATASSLKVFPFSLSECPLESSEKLEAICIQLVSLSRIEKSCATVMSISRTVSAMKLFLESCKSV